MIIYFSSLKKIYFCLYHHNILLPNFVKCEKNKNKSQIMDGDNPNTFQLFYQTVIFNLKNRIGHLPINESNKEKHIKTLDNFDSSILKNIIYSAENKLSTLNVQYIVCFLINMKRVWSCTWISRPAWTFFFRWVQWNMPTWTICSLPLKRSITC